MGRLLLIFSACLALCLASGAAPRTGYTAKDFVPTREYFERPFGWFEFDGRTRCYRWVLERLDQKTKAGDRTGLAFHKDPDIPEEFSPSPEDYVGSKYDIGHGAPNQDDGENDEQTRSTFTVAQAGPQTPELNRGPWRTAEKYCFTFAHRIGVRELWVLEAPAFIPDRHGALCLDVVRRIEKKKDGREIVHYLVVPTHYIKSMLAVFDDDHVEMKTWKFSNTKEPELFEDAAITADQAETDLGLKLWDGLPGDVQDNLEKQL